MHQAAADRTTPSRWIAIAAWCLALAACGGGGGGTPQPSGPEIPGQFMPLQSGDRWVYRSAAFDPIIVQVLEPATAQGLAGMRVRTSSHMQGALLPPVSVAESVLADQADAVREVVTLSADGLAPALGVVPLLRKPVRQGDRFEQVTTTAPLDLDADGQAENIAVQSFVTVVGLADQSVPAGDFAGCLHLRTEMRQSTRLSASGQRVESIGTSDIWLAPGIGPVRIDIKVVSGGVTVEQVSRVLTAYRVGGRSNEAVAPRVVLTAPAEGAMHPSTQGAEVEFSEPMDPEVLAGQVSVLDGQGQRVPGTVVVGERRARFEPVRPFGTGRYTLRIGAGAIDMAGQALGADHRVNFEVDATGPQLASMSPAPGSTGVPIDGPIVLRLSEPPADAIAAGQVALVDAESGFEVSANVTLAGDTFTLQPLQPLRRDRAYQVRLCCLADRLGNVMEPVTTAAFRTAPGRFSRMTAWLDDGLDSAVGDLNGDGRADLAGVAWVPGSDRGAIGLYLRLQQPDGTPGPVIDTGWRHADRACAGARPMIGDLDRDGRPDLVLAVGSCRVEFLLQQADGRFAASAAAPPIDVNDGFGAPRLADLDGDGRVELVRPRGPGVIQRWRANALGGFEPDTEARTGLDAQAGLVLPEFGFFDLNGDGRLDLLLPLRQLASEEVVVALQGTDGHFTPVQRVAGVDKAEAAGDLDHDGLADLVLRTGLFAAGPQRLQVWRQGPAGRWTMTLDLPDTEQAAAGLADVDGDGLLDLLLHRPGAHLAWRRQGPGGALAAAEHYEVLQADGALHLADINGDGRVDVVVGGHAMTQLASPGASAAAPLAQRVLQQLQRRARAASSR